MKSHSCETLSCTLYDTKTVILLGNVFICLSNLLICQQRFYSTFFNVFLNFFLIKTRFLTFFILGVNIF